jgi:hypothetical protein
MIATGIVALLALAGCKGDDPASKAQAFCHDVIQLGCVRAFDCIPPANRSAAFTQTYGTSLERCQAMPDKCAQYYSTCPNFDPDGGATCLSDFTNLSCSDLLFIDDSGDPAIGLPGSCGAVCP